MNNKISINEYVQKTFELNGIDAKLKTYKDHPSINRLEVYFDGKHFSGHNSFKQYLLSLNDNLKTLIEKLQNKCKSVDDISRFVDGQYFSIQNNSDVGCYSFVLCTLGEIYSIFLTPKDYNFEFIAKSIFTKISFLVKRNDNIINIIEEFFSKENILEDNEFNDKFQVLHELVEKIQNKFNCNIYWNKSNLVVTKNGHILYELKANPNESRMDSFIKLVDFLATECKKSIDKQNKKMKFLAEIIGETYE